jgi:hypothetical protein
LEIEAMTMGEETLHSQMALPVVIGPILEKVIVEYLVPACHIWHLFNLSININRG